MVKDFFAISGKPGLFKKVSHSKDKLIVESLLDGRRMPAQASSKVISLEDVSIYTSNGDTKISDIFVSIFERGLELDPKSSPGDLKSKFEELLPAYDKNRVYASDIKKVFVWYNLLKAQGYLTPEIVEAYKTESDKVKGAEAN